MPRSRSESAYAAFVSPYRSHIDRFAHVFSYLLVQTEACMNYISENLDTSTLLPCFCSVYSLRSYIDFIERIIRAWFP